MMPKSSRKLQEAVRSLQLIDQGLGPVRKLTGLRRCEQN
jgi:hypothetical protein